MDTKASGIDQLVEAIDNISELSRDDDDYDEIATYNSYEIMGLGVDVHIHEKKMDVFLSFDYSDIPSDLIKKQDPDAIEELASDEYMYWCEKYFIIFLKEKGNYFVCEWDDGSYMCPGYTARIGYRHIPCDVDVINKFIDICKIFYKKIGRWKSSTLLVKITNDFTKRLGYYQNGLPLQLENGKVEIIKSKVPINEEALLQNPYIGKEYAFFRLNDSVENSEIVSVPASDAKIFEALINNLEYLNDTTYFLIGNKLIGLSHHFIWISSYDKGLMASYAPKIEQTNIMTQIQAFLPYADEGLRNIYFEEYKNRLPHGQEIYIFTEGSTDWKHMKYHWSYLKNGFKWSHLDIKFHEYEPENSTQQAALKLNMDGNKLCDMCSSFSQRKNDELIIFIADRDRDDVAKKLSEAETNFKYWGNNVYSIVLPVPPHREATPKICIEHYYTDKEIKMEFPCNDGIKRRLYIGNEFDSYGRAVAIDRFCVNRNACGEYSIRIIDGSSNERGLSLNKDCNVNYALSKMQFVDFICGQNIELTDATKGAFSKLFEVVSSVKKHHDAIKPNILN